MSKTIAERFADEIGSTPKTDSVSELYSMVLTWLIKQPENDWQVELKCFGKLGTATSWEDLTPEVRSGLFTLDAVEQIAREAHNKGEYSATYQNKKDEFDYWWQAKKAELLGKV